MKRPTVRQGAGIAISVACLWFVFHRVNLDELRTALSNLKWHFVVFGVGCVVVGYTVRIQRWAVMLRAGGAHVSTRTCVAPFLGSIALNNVLPFRAGDVVRGLVFPAAIGVRRTAAVASLLVERLFDLVTLLVTLGVGFSLGAVIRMPDWLSDAIFLLSILVGASFLVAVVISPVLRNAFANLEERATLRGRGRLRLGFSVAKDVLQGVSDMSRPRVLVATAMLSMFVWLGESGLFWALLNGLAIADNFPAALLIMAVATLSTLVPSSPGYVGPFHLAAYSAVTMLGGSPAQAAAFAVLAHLGLWGPTTLAGGIAMLSNTELFKDPPSQQLLR